MPPAKIREHHVERGVLKALEEVGCICIKVGQYGWPDRLIIYAPGRCLWFEIKPPDRARLDPKQKIRRDQLRKRGHEVYIVTSPRQALALVAQARRSLSAAEARRVYDPTKKARRNLEQARKRKDGDSPYRAVRHGSRPTRSGAGDEEDL
jgi:hypothetical protein